MGQYETGLLLLAICLAAFLCLHFYLRITVFKAYRVLSENQVVFDSKHLFSKKRMREEIVPKYPRFEKEINKFQKNFHFSLLLGTILLVVIMILGTYLLFWARKGA